MKTSVIVLLTVLATSLLPAQGRGAKDTAPLPLQGKMLPETSAFDADGNRLQLRELLQGRHAVIVFGCLT